MNHGMQQHLVCFMGSSIRGVLMHFDNDAYTVTHLIFDCFSIAQPLLLKTGSVPISTIYRGASKPMAEFDKDDITIDTVVSVHRPGMGKSDKYSWKARCENINGKQFIELYPCCKSLHAFLGVNTPLNFLRSLQLQRTDATRAAWDLPADGAEEAQGLFEVEKSRARTYKDHRDLKRKQAEGVQLPVEVSIQLQGYGTEGPIWVQVKPSLFDRARIWVHATPKNLFHLMMAAKEYDDGAAAPEASDDDQGESPEGTQVIYRSDKKQMVAKLGRKSKIFPVASGSPKSIKKARKMARKAFVDKDESNDDDVVLIHGDESPHPEAASSAGGPNIFKFGGNFKCVCAPCVMCFSTFDVQLFEQDFHVL